MKRVGVVVEGPSDFVFWSRFLGRTMSSRGYYFDVRSMKGRGRIIQEADKLIDGFRKAEYFCALFILDGDDSSCAAEVVNLFAPDIRLDARQMPPANRFANVFVTLSELESWVLADEVCIQQLLRLPAYCAPAQEPRPAGKAKFLRLCKEQGKFPTGLADRYCAAQAAQLFDPSRTAKVSKSFHYFWTRLTERLKPSAT